MRPQRKGGWRISVMPEPCKTNWNHVAALVARVANVIVVGMKQVSDARCCVSTDDAAAARERIARPRTPPHRPNRDWGSYPARALLLIPGGSSANQAAGGAAWADRMAPFPPPGEVSLAANRKLKSGPASGAGDGAGPARITPTSCLDLRSRREQS